MTTTAAPPGVRFWLGTHRPGWLAHTEVPLFVSHRTLRGRRQLPQAQGPWALDSGGFTELALHGRWQTSVAEYVEAVARYRTEVGGLVWAAPMDWMCEPSMLAATGRTVTDHQARTVENYCLLRQADPSLPFIPVLQGWTLADYLACMDRYQAAGVDLVGLPLVGVGSVCRRQHTSQIGAIITELATAGLRLHGFGVKRRGLARYGPLLESSDSLAWSAHARRRPARLGCVGHRNCANCLAYALAWRELVLADLDRPWQPPLGYQPLPAGVWS